MESGLQDFDHLYLLTNPILFSIIEFNLKLKSFFYPSFSF